MKMCGFFLVFEQYQKARTQFVQTVADLASKPQNIGTLQDAGKHDKDKPQHKYFLGHSLT